MSTFLSALAVALGKAEKRRLPVAEIGHKAPKTEWGRRTNMVHCTARCEKNLLL